MASTGGDKLPFADYCARVEERLKRFYGIHVLTTDVPDPLIGDLDGEAIHIDYAVTPEQRFFLLAHLFGHTVQWNTKPGAFEFGRPRQPPVAEELLPMLMDYERDAARYALAMLHSTGITEADQWLSDFTACDMEYLSHYYRTGEKRDFLDFWLDNTPRLEPCSIPPFTPVRRTLRQEGIVI